MTNYSSGRHNHEEWTHRGPEQMDLDLRDDNAVPKGVKKEDEWNGVPPEMRSFIWDLIRLKNRQ